MKVRCCGQRLTCMRPQKYSSMSFRYWIMVASLASKPGISPDGSWMLIRVMLNCWQTRSFSWGEDMGGVLPHRLKDAPSSWRSAKFRRFFVDFLPRHKSVGQRACKTWERRGRNYHPSANLYIYNSQEFGSCNDSSLYGQLITEKIETVAVQSPELVITPSQPATVAANISNNIVLRATKPA